MTQVLRCLEVRGGTTPTNEETYHSKMKLIFPTTLGNGICSFLGGFFLYGPSNSLDPRKFAKDLSIRNISNLVVFLVASF